MVAKEQWMAPRQENGCIHSVNKYFLSICYMPGTMLAAACTAVRQTDKCAGAASQRRWYLSWASSLQWTEQRITTTKTTKHFLSTFYVSYVCQPI